MTLFFLERVDTSKTTSLLIFFLLLPPGSRFSMASVCLSSRLSSPTCPSTAASLAACHLQHAYI